VIPALYGLDAALDELLDEGVAYRRNYYQARMDFLDGVFAELGLVPRVAPSVRSRSVRSLPLPEGVDYDDLHDAMKAEGYAIYGGLGEAAKTSVRVCALGALKIEALEGFALVLERVIARTPVAVA
jgi:2-aminoethylphosphonate-pyruvate transaminase